MKKEKNVINRFIGLLLSLSTLVLIGSSGTPATNYLPEEKKESRKENAALSIDGPYILYRPDGSARVISVDKDKNVIDRTYETLPEDFSFRVTDHNGDYPFEVRLHPVSRPVWKAPRSEKVFVMSDPHGRMDCVVSLLRGNGVIDENLHWSFGGNHLVIIGDIFDRGKDATQIFWLVYKLEDEAEKAGGRVSFLLGNHETMVLADDLRYTKEKYKSLAEELGMRYPQLFGPDTELGRWLETRNTIEIIGTDLYVHAGLGRMFYDEDLSVSQVNEEISKALFMSKSERKALSPLTGFLYGNEGPLWYRGLVRTDEKYNPIKSKDLKKILKRYTVERIIVGHTIFDDISTFHGGKVIDVNVDNKKNQEEKRGRGLLIDGDDYLVVGDEGIQRNINETRSPGRRPRKDPLR